MSNDLAKQKDAQGGLTQMVGCTFAPLKNTVVVRIALRASSAGFTWIFHISSGVQGRFTTCQPLILFKN
jgi:hypothetical protein